MKSKSDKSESESMCKLSVEALDIVEGDAELTLEECVMLRLLNWKSPCSCEMLMEVLLSCIASMTASQECSLSF